MTESVTYRCTSTAKPRQKFGTHPSDGYLPDRKIPQQSVGFQIISADDLIGQSLGLAGDITGDSSFVDRFLEILSPAPGKMIDVTFTIVDVPSSTALTIQPGFQPSEAQLEPVASIDGALIKV